MPRLLTPNHASRHSTLMRLTSRNLWVLVAIGGASACISNAGSVVGYLRDQNWFARYQSNPLGVGQYEFAVNANAHGSATLGGFAATDVFGRFQMDNLPTGTYALASWDVWWRSAFAFNLPVPVTGSSPTADLRLKATMWGYPAFWDETGYHEFGQTFQASGPVTMIYLRDPLNTAFTRTVTIHADGPGGAQVGNSRTYGNGGDQRLIYGRGQMPTVAWQTYYLRVRTPAVATKAVLMQMDPRPDDSDPMPGGCLWLGNGGLPTPYPDRDLGVAIMSDDDGLLTDLFARPGGTVWNSVTSVGQTFIAQGVGLISAAFWLADPAVSGYVVRVFAGGPGGAQVGTAKRGKPARVTADPEMIVVWSPGECPLTPGEMYYVEVTRDGGGTFNSVYANPSNPFAFGQAYLNASPASANVDLAGTIMEEASAGSATQPAVRITEEPVVPEARRQSDALTLQWSTDVAADSVVEYAVHHPPYTRAWTNAELTQTHEATLTNLLPHTLYHLRVRSGRPDFRPAVSRDFVVCTLPAASNLLANPGFETGSGSGPARPVVGWTTSGSVDIKAADGGWFWGLTPRSGNWLLQGAVNGTSSDGYLYQRVTSITPGQDYTFSAWVQTAMRENDTWKYDVWNSRDRLIHVRLGLDPTGGTNPAAASVIWTPRTYSHRRYTQLATRARAQASALTVFVRMQGSGGQWHLYAVDDCALTHEDIPLRLHSPVWNEGRFQAVLAGPPDRTNLIERSMDFQTWLPVTNVVNASGETLFEDPGETVPGPLFYRAKQLP